jgi:hypothetical protein
MNLKPKAKPQRVVSAKSLPTRAVGLTYLLIWTLFQKVYLIEQWVTVTVYVLLAIITLIQIFMAGREAQVDIFDTPEEK